MKTNKNKEEERLPDFLQEIKGDNPFRIPHNYFREFPEQIMEQIQKEKEARSQNAWWRFLVSRWDALSLPKPALALVMVLLISAIFWFNNSQNLSLEENFTSMEIAQYVQEHIDDFEVSDFYVQELEGIDILGEEWKADEMEPILDDLMEDMDLETLQRIL